MGDFEALVHQVEVSSLVQESALIADLMGELVHRAAFWSGPLLAEDNFYSLEYRNARSVGSVDSAPSVDGSELGDHSDLDPSFLESEEDSDREFERLQQYTSKVRLENFKKEHSSGVPEMKRLRTEVVIDTSDLANEYDALPPLESLSIHCNEEIPLEVLGHVTAVVDCLVVIQSDACVALDFDSVLFDADRNSIGVVFDLFGPVRSPFYSVRYNTKEEAAKMQIGSKVYYAPREDQYTKTVIETHLNGNKCAHDIFFGETDANEGISDEEAMFSDDEKEKEYRFRKANASKMFELSNLTRNKKNGKRGRVQFSEPTIHHCVRGRGAHHRVRGQRQSWNWHNRREGCSFREQLQQRGQKHGLTSEVKVSIADADNPYAKFGCSGGISLTDSRQH